VEQRRDRAGRGARALERLGVAAAADRDLDSQRGERPRMLGIERPALGLAEHQVGAAVRTAARRVAERVEQRLELAGATAARRELAIGEQGVGGSVAVARREPVPHDLAHARDLIHRAERAVVSGLPREARPGRVGSRAGDQLRRGTRQPLLVVDRHVGEHVDAHDLVHDDPAVADRVDELAGDEARQRGFDLDPRRERCDRGGRDRSAQDGERFERGARGCVERRQIPGAGAEPRARVLAAQGERHAAGPRERGVEPLRFAVGLLEVVPQLGGVVGAQAMELDLRDRGADRGGERIAPDHDDPAQRGRSEQERREEAGRLVGAQVLDVIDHQHARLLRERLGERARDAAQGAFGARPQCRCPIARVTFDQGAGCSHARCELSDQPGLARPQRAVQRHQRHQRKMLLELCKLTLTADKRHRTDRSHGIRDL
jgi:hypothetical protein